MQIVDLTGRSEVILVAASRLFARHSYANVTMEQVAAAVQAVPGALYHHFHDKEELIFQCYLRGLAIYRLEIEAAAEPARASDRSEGSRCRTGNRRQDSKRTDRRDRSAADLGLQLTASNMSFPDAQRRIGECE